MVFICIGKGKKRRLASPCKSLHFISQRVSLQPQRMEENGMAEWEIPGYDGDGEIYNSDEDMKEPKLSSTNWILNTGLSLGKKVVITGVVISSLPLLLPPLVVVSALGCALSLPFGVVFASYACTYNLMSKLLLPSPPVMLQEYDQTIFLPEVGEEEEEEHLVVATEYQKEEEDEEEERHMSLLEEKKRIHDDDDYPENVQVGEVINAKVEREQQTAQNEKPSYAELSNAKNREMNIDVGGLTVDVTSKAHIDKLAADEEERYHFSEDKNEKVILAATVNKDKKDAKKGNSSSKEIERLGKREELLEGDEIHEIVVQETSKLGSDSIDKERCIMFGSDHNNVLLNEEEKKPVGVKEMLDAPQSVKDRAIDDDDVCCEMNIDKSITSIGVVLNDGGIDEKIEHRSSTVTIYNDPGENYSQSKRIAGDGGHSDEVLFGEENIWRRMEAIRVIVGYKAPRSASYLEELKALYLFTGIEPPSDSAEFDNKLSFLMSVIGLK